MLLSHCFPFGGILGMQDYASSRRGGSDRMNSVGFGIFIGLFTIITIFLIQKVLDNPNT